MLKNSKIRSAALMAILLAATLANMSFEFAPDTERSYSMTTSSSEDNSKDVLIISDSKKFAYFGWHRPTSFSTDILQLLNRTILWADSYSIPAETRIVMFWDEADAFAAEVYNWLRNTGYLAVNIESRSVEDVLVLPSTYYLEKNLVIYWNTTDHDSTNIVNSGVPFITVCAMQTDEMGIGIGAPTMLGVNDTFHVVNTDYYPTLDNPLGPLIMDDSYSFVATEAAFNARTLIKAEVESTTDQIEMSMVQNVKILPDGSASMTLNISIPESPLAEILRETFFANASSLEKDTEYEVPDNVTVSESTFIEEAVREASLAGDVGDGDGCVEGEDIELIAEKLGYSLGDDEWDPNLDLNWDGRIDMRDVAVAAHNYGKTENNTGSLFVSGYFNGTPVNCTDLYFRGPEGSQKTNMSESGFIWYHLLPGSYIVFGTYDGIEETTQVVIEPGKLTYAILDFGGQPAIPVNKYYAPVKEVLHEGLALEQLLLLGFDINITQSTTVPWSSENETRIQLLAHSLHIAEFLGSPDWQVKIGPQNESAIALAAEFVFTKIEYVMLMLQSVPGDQTYVFNWQLSVELPPGSGLLNQAELEALNWTIDFGGGSSLKANVSVISERVVVDEIMTVAERNITASETYLETAFATYKTFSVNYTNSFVPSVATRETCLPDGDWSKTWTTTIAPRIGQKSWTFGPLTLSLKATPTLTIKWYVGWEKTWAGGKLKWFETWMQVTPSIKVEASVSAGVSYTRQWSYTLLQWSTRFSFWIGCVPVWAKLKLTVTAGITLNAYGRISVSTWATAKAWFKAGVRWQNGWSTIWNHGWGSDRGGPHISGAAGLSVTPEVACRLAFLFYDVGGPFVEAVPYARLSIDYYTDRANTWSISLKLKILVGVTLAGWLNKILKLRSYSKQVANFELKSWNGTWP